MRKLQPNGLWLLRFVAKRMKATGGGGYAVHLALPTDAPAGLSMSTMRGLERRGLVEEFRTGMFRPTAEGLKHLEQEGELP